MKGGAQRADTILIVDDTTLGTVGSAPARPLLLRKALGATVLAAVLLAILWFVVEQFDITLEGISGA